MRLTVLGGSAAGTNTGQGCSGYLVESATARVVLDLGPGTLQELRKHANYRMLSAIVISHMHVDHIADLLALRFALAYNPISPPKPVPLVLPPGGRAVLDKLAAVFTGQGEVAEFFGSVFAIAEFDPGAELVLSGVRLSFLPTVHFIPCWAIRLAGDDSHVGDLTYTADSGPAAALAAFAHGSRVLISEATYIDPPDTPFEQRGHLTASEAGVVATAAAVPILVLSHLWEELGFEQYRAAAARNFSGRIELARPGLHLEW